jgi:hypothetical protein
MDERQLVPGGCVGLDDVGGAEQGDQPVMDQTVLEGRKNVRSDVDLVAR